MKMKWSGARPAKKQQPLRDNLKNMSESNRKNSIQKRHQRVRAKISGTAQCPRLAVFRSSQHIYAQLIDDVAQKTIISVSDLKLDSGKAKSKETLTERAKKVGNMVAKLALEKGKESIVFDRGGFAYHGVVKAVAEGAREAGLKF